MDHVVKAGEKRLEEREAAIKRLNQAREKLKNCTNDVYAAKKEQLDKQLLFEKAKENLDRASRQLRCLGSQEVELVRVYIPILILSTNLLLEGHY